MSIDEVAAEAAADYRYWRENEYLGPEPTDFVELADRLEEFDAAVDALAARIENAFPITVTTPVNTSKESR